MNEKIKQKAQELYPIESHASEYVAFLRGAESAQRDWVEIKRDKSGFYDGDISDLYEYTPFIVRECEWDGDYYSECFDIVTPDMFSEWAGDLDLHPKYTHILPNVPLINDEQW